MPKVYTYNAEFNPISFTDRVAPALLYKEEYDKQQEAYYKYLEEASELADLKDSDIDADSYKIYTDHMAQINKLGELLETQGLRGGEARALALQLRRDQMNNIDPLRKKLKKRSSLIQGQREAIMKNPNLIFDTDYDTVSLDNINESSTYRPIDLGEVSNVAANLVYNSKMSNKGQDITDYDKFRERYGYNSLSPDKQEKFNRALDMGVQAGSSTYRKYLDDYNVAWVRAHKGQDGSDNGKTPKPFVIKDSDGNMHKVSTDDNGVQYITGLDGHLRQYNELSEDQIRAYVLQKQKEYIEQHGSSIDDKDLQGKLWEISAQATEEITKLNTDRALYGGDVVVEYTPDRGMEDSSVVKHIIVKDADSGNNYIYKKSKNGKYEKTPAEANVGYTAFGLNYNKKDNKYSKSTETINKDSLPSSWALRDENKIEISNYNDIAKIDSLNVSSVIKSQLRQLTGSKSLQEIIAAGKTIEICYYNEKGKNKFAGVTIQVK